MAVAFYTMTSDRNVPFKQGIDRVSAKSNG